MKQTDFILDKNYFLIFSSSLIEIPQKISDKKKSGQF